VINGHHGPGGASVAGVGGANSAGISSNIAYCSPYGASGVSNVTGRSSSGHHGPCGASVAGVGGANSAGISSNNAHCSLCGASVAGRGASSAAIPAFGNHQAMTSFLLC
jgi:hypothetical protein